jgi:hypothetical protein
MMINDKMQFGSFNDIQRIEDKFPIINDRVLIDLVNSIQVNKDLISFREKQGLFGQLFDNITGADRFKSDN